MVTNLLDNAIKFTSETGKIEVVVGVHDGEAVLELKDDGRGIDTATLPRVFDFFAQGEDSLDRAHGGLGIGLTIVRGLVELHSGHVEARSEGAGQGSTFVVRLPRRSRRLFRIASERSEPERARPARFGHR